MISYNSSCTTDGNVEYYYYLYSHVGRIKTLMFKMLTAQFTSTTFTVQSFSNRIICQIVYSLADVPREFGSAQLRTQELCTAPVCRPPWLFVVLLHSLQIQN